MHKDNLNTKKHRKPKRALLVRFHSSALLSVFLLLKSGRGQAPPTHVHNNRLINKATAEIAEARLIFTSIVKLNLIILYLHKIKPKPAQAVSLSAFYSRPDWRYLHTAATVLRGQAESTFGYPVIAVLRHFDNAVDVMALRAVHGASQFLCPLAGLTQSDTGLSGALLRGWQQPSTESFIDLLSIYLSFSDNVSVHPTTGLTTPNLIA